MTSPLRSVVATPHALYLLVTSLVGRLPTAMAALAIVQLVRLQGGGFELAGALTASYVLAGALGQPLLGRWIDRAGQTVILLVSGIAGSAAFAGIALFGVALPVLAVACALIAGFFTPPLEPALRSIWPRIIRGEAPLKAAFSLDAGAQEIIFIAGPLLSVAGIAAFGATGNIVFAAALGLVGTLAFAANRLSRSVRPDAAAAVAQRTPVRDGNFRRIVAFQFGVGVPIGVLTISVTAYGEQNGVPEFAGWALAVNALGALIGATVSALRPTDRAPERLLAVGGLFLGLGYLPLALLGSSSVPVVLLLVLAVIAGLSLPPTLSQVFVYVQKTVEPSSLTEANAWVVSAFAVGIALGTTGGGLLAGGGAAASVTLMTLVGCAVVAVFSLAVLPRFLRATAPGA